MTDRLVSAVRQFLAAADKAEFSKIEFFTNRGLQAELLNPGDPGSSFVRVSDGNEGTVLPPIRVGMRPMVVQLSQYYNEVNQSIVDPIKGWSILKLPIVIYVDNRWSIYETGYINGDAPAMEYLMAYP